MTLFALSFQDIRLRLQHLSENILDLQFCHSVDLALCIIGPLQSSEIYYNSTKRHIIGAMVQLAKCLHTSTTALVHSPAPIFWHCGMSLCFQHWGGRGRRFSWAHWPASLTQSVKPRFQSDPISKDKMNSQSEE